MEIELKRHFSLRDATDGTLHIEGLYFCDTVERTTTCLKPGKYRLLMRQDDNGNWCIDIVTRKNAHPKGSVRTGNGVCRLTDGSIIIGKHQANGLCIKTSLYYERLIARFKRRMKRKDDEPLLLYIREVTSWF